MDSLRILKHHVFFYRMFGLWPVERPTFWHWAWSYVFSAIFLVGYSATASLSMLFLDSLGQIVDTLTLNSSLVMTCAHSQYAMKCSMWL